MKRVAFVTSSVSPQLAQSDALVEPYLVKRDVIVVPAAWDDPLVDWKKFDAVIVRSTWNYHKKYTSFCNWLSRLSKMRVKVWNPIATLRWNLHKSYLFRLEADGVPIIPSLCIDRFSWKHIVSIRKWKTIVVKPAVGASAYGVKRFLSSNMHLWIPYVWLLQRAGAVIVQEYTAEILKGEYSLVFFDKKFSHAVLRIPAQNDFRTQKIYGATVMSVKIAPAIVKQVEKIISSIDGHLLYTRVDGVIVHDVFKLMELELCEPNLFLDTDLLAPKRFADAIFTSI